MLIVNTHSVVILKKCPIHHLDDTTDMIHEVGALVHFFAIILTKLQSNWKYIFTKLKTEMKAIESELPSTVDTDTMLLTALSAVTLQDSQNWIEGCGLHSEWIIINGHWSQSIIICVSMCGTEYQCLCVAKYVSYGVKNKWIAPSTICCLPSTAVYTWVALSSSFLYPHLM